MIPALYTHAGAALLAAAIAGACAWYAQGWRMGEQLASLKAGHAKTLQAIADKTAQARDAVGKYEAVVHANLADKDTRHYKELTHAKTETDRLRACVAAGTCGVRIKTVYVRDSSSGGSADTSSRTVGDAALELDAETGLRVLDLRESIQLDAEKLSYLQQYARKCWSAGAEAQAVVP